MPITEVFEFRGRIENFPARPRVKNGITTYSMHVTPQNIYDDGRRNDYINRMKQPRIIVNWMEFEGPVFKSGHQNPYRYSFRISSEEE